MWGVVVRTIVSYDYLVCTEQFVCILLLLIPLCMLEEPYPLTSAIVFVTLIKERPSGSEVSTISFQRCRFKQKTNKQKKFHQSWKESNRLQFYGNKITWSHFPSLTMVAPTETRQKLQTLVYIKKEFYSQRQSYFENKTKIR